MTTLASLFMGGGTLIAWTLLRARFELPLRMDFEADEELADREFQAQVETERRGFDEAEKHRKDAFDAERAAFEQSERERRLAFDAEEERQRELFETNEDARIAVLTKAAEGNPRAVVILCEAVLPLAPPIATPDDLPTRVTDYEVGYRVIDGTTVQLRIHLPHPSLIPDREPELTPAERVIRYNPIPEPQRQRVYAEFVHSFSLCHAVALLSSCPHIRQVTVESCLVSPDPSTGLDRLELLLLAKYPLENFRTISLERTEAVAVHQRFEARWRPSRTSGGSEELLVPELSDETFTWATVDDDGFEIPVGVLPVQEWKRQPNPHRSPAAADARESAKATATTEQLKPWEIQKLIHVWVAIHCMAYVARNAGIEPEVTGEAIRDTLLVHLEWFNSNQSRLSAQLADNEGLATVVQEIPRIIENPPPMNRTEILGCCDLARKADLKSHIIGLTSFVSAVVTNVAGREGPHAGFSLSRALLETAEELEHFLDADDGNSPGAAPNAQQGSPSPPSPEALLLTIALLFRYQVAGFLPSFNSGQRNIVRMTMNEVYDNPATSEYRDRAVTKAFQVSEPDDATAHSLCTELKSYAPGNPTLLENFAGINARLAHNSGPEKRIEIARRTSAIGKWLGFRNDEIEAAIVRQRIKWES